MAELHIEAERRCAKEDGSSSAVRLSSQNCREVPDILSWIQCFGMYVCVVAAQRPAVANIISMGKGTLLAKLALESAYCIVPVHPDDRLLLGMEWKGCWYVDTVLPFGLCSAPKTTVADVDHGE